MKDIFSDAKTASFFFTNDQRVLLDIIIRETTDLPPPDPMRVK